MNYRQIYARKAECEKQTKEMCLDLATIEAMVSVIQKTIAVIGNAWRYAVEKYPNKRVAHLSKHSHKKRVRKKNTKRITSWLLEGVKCGNY